MDRDERAVTNLAGEDRRVFRLLTHGDAAREGTDESVVGGAEENGDRVAGVAGGVDNAVAGADEAAVGPA